jgi:hypothetical protein
MVVGFGHLVAWWLFNPSMYTNFFFLFCWGLVFILTPSRSGWLSCNSNLGYLASRGSTVVTQPHTCCTLQLKKRSSARAAEEDHLIWLLVKEIYV